MIGAQQRLAKRRTRSKKSTHVSTDERERVVALVRVVRAKLQPLAAPDQDFTCVQFKPSAMKLALDLGSQDGIGFLLKMASVETEHDGTISDSELQRFRREGVDLVDGLASGVLNYSVVLSLFLTIFTSLVVLHAGKGPYDLLVPGPRLGSASDTAAAADAADYLWPENAVGLRWGFYVVEWSFLAYGTIVSSAGLMQCVFFYGTLSVHLPSLIAKCELIVAKPSKLTNVFQGFVQGLNALMTVLPCIAFRASAVAFLSMCAVFVLYFTFQMYIATVGDVVDVLKAQQREARALLRLARPASAVAHVV